MRKVFNKIISKIEKDYPELNITIWENDKFTPSGASGEYMDNDMHIAIGPPGKTDWQWVLGTLAHEFAHFLREKRHTSRYNKRLYSACHELYSKLTPDSDRYKAAYWVLLDEYRTDSEAYEKVAKSWGIQRLFSDWWYWANLYNYKIKYLLETGILFSDRQGYVTAPNYKLTREQILKPLSSKKKREISQLLEQKKITPVLVCYEEPAHNV